MRGKGVKHRDGRVRVGITPAYAGKSRTLGTGGSGRRDHPRVCGEKGFCIRCTARMVGSPPRMRGKVYLLCLLPIRTGITPAYAGKSLAQCFVRFSLRDHPRVCGEKFCKWLQEPNTMGSPPRMRGKVLPPLQCGLYLGITPAYAGKRLKRSRSIVPHAAIVPLFPSVCNKPAGSDGSPAGHDAPPFLPIENAAPASPAYNLRSL